MPNQMFDPQTGASRDPADVPLPAVDPMNTPAALTDSDAPVVTALGPIEPEAGRSHVPVRFSSGTGGKAAVFAAGLVLALLVVLVFGLLSRRHADAALARDQRRSAEERVPVDVVRVERASAESELTLPGEAQPLHETTIFARTSGYVDKWFVDIGDRVTQGQELASIETPELDAQLTAAKAKLDALKAEAHVAETSTQFAKSSYERWEAAAPGGAVSQQERDQKKSELDEATAKLEAAKAQIALGAADVQRLTTLTGFKQVLAPFDGVITRRPIDIGALVTAGSTTNTSPLYTIQQADRILVFVDVPQAATASIKEGMTVYAEESNSPGHRFVGKVERTSHSLDPVSRTLKVQVLVPNPNLELLPGSFLRVTFDAARTKPPVRIPASALNFRPGGPQVAIVARDGRVTFRDITIARDMGDYIEIGSGLTGEEDVALNVGNEVVDGQQVEAHEVDLAAVPPPPGPPAPAKSADRSTAAAPVTAPTPTAATTP